MNIDDNLITEDEDDKEYHRQQRLNCSAIKIINEKGRLEFKDFLDQIKAKYRRR